MLVFDIHRASGLKDVETFGKNDPYVKIEWGNQIKKTTVKKNAGASAVWNERIFFDLQKVSRITLHIMEHDFFRDDVIGVSYIELISLQFGKPNTVVIFDDRGKPSGSLVITPYASAFVVDCLQASNLKDVETFGKNDPYLRLLLGTEKRKTEVRDDSDTACIWNERFLFEPNASSLLRIDCNDKETFSDKNIGSISVNFNTVQKDIPIPLQIADSDGESAGVLTMVFHDPIPCPPTIIDPTADYNGSTLANMPLTPHPPQPVQPNYASYPTAPPPPQQQQQQPDVSYASPPPQQIVICHHEPQIVQKEETHILRAIGLGVGVVLAVGLQLVVGILIGGGSMRYGNGQRRRTGFRHRF